MKIPWKTVLLKTIVWIAAEIFLNLLGVDTLADYSEFLHEQEVAAFSHFNQPVILMPVMKRPQTKVWGYIY